MVTVVVVVDVVGMVDVKDAVGVVVMVVVVVVGTSIASKTIISHISSGLKSMLGFTTRRNRPTMGSIHLKLLNPSGRVRG